jgi:hypothetical protein
MWSQPFSQSHSMLWRGRGIGILLHTFFIVGIVWRRLVSYASWLKMPRCRLFRKTYRSQNCYGRSDYDQEGKVHITCQERKHNHCRGRKVIIITYSVSMFIADSHIPCRSPAANLPQPYHYPAILRQCCVLRESSLSCAWRSPSGDYRLLNCYNNLCAVSYTSTHVLAPK